MYKFTNTTNKTVFLSNAEWCKQKIKPYKDLESDRNKWEITDRWENKWRVIFNEDTRIFSIFNVCHYPLETGEKPFKVDIITYDNIIEILEAQDGKRKLQADKFLKKFATLAIMVNCYLQYGYIQIVE